MNSKVHQLLTTTPIFIRQLKIMQLPLKGLAYYEDPATQLLPVICLPTHLDKINTAEKYQWKHLIKTSETQILSIAIIVLQAMIRQPQEILDKLKLFAYDQSLIQWADYGIPKNQIMVRIFVEYFRLAGNDPKKSLKLITQHKLLEYGIVILFKTLLKGQQNSTVGQKLLHICKLLHLRLESLANQFNIPVYKLAGQNVLSDCQNTIYFTVNSYSEHQPDSYLMNLFNSQNNDFKASTVSISSIVTRANSTDRPQFQSRVVKDTIYGQNQPPKQDTPHRDNFIKQQPVYMSPTMGRNSPFQKNPISNKFILEGQQIRNNFNTNSFPVQNQPLRIVRDHDFMNPSTLKPHQSRLVFTPRP